MDGQPEEPVASFSHIEIPVDGSELIRDGLTIYGMRVLKGHFPQPVDGLKDVHRRAIWAGRLFPETGKQSTGAVGAIKEYHDHNNESIYMTLVRMSQDFQFSPTLVTFFGGNGDYIGDTAASSRYTSVTLSPFAKDVFFKNIELDAIPMIQGMDLQMTEPKFLVPAVPLGLTLGNVTVGYGFGSKTAPRNFGAICDLVVNYCQHLSAGGTPTNFDIRRYSHLLLPDFPVKNVILNADELLAAYATGDFNHKIDIEGTATLTKNSIRIHTLPVGRSFDVVSRIRSAIDNVRLKKSKAADVDIWMEQNVIDAIEEPQWVTIVLKKNATTVFQAWDVIRRHIGFTDSFHPNPNFVDHEGYIYEHTPQEILTFWFRRRQDLILSSKRRQLRRMFEQLRITEALLIIADHTDKVISILKKSSNPEEGIAFLVKTFQLTVFQAKHIAGAPMSTISKASKDELRQRFADQKEKITEFQATFSRVPEEIAAQAEELKKRYANERKSPIPNYVGYVSMLDGCIQFETAAEVEEILADFPNVPIAVYTYDGSRLLQVDEDGRFKTGGLSKYATGDIYGLPFNGESGYTVNINPDGSTCCVRGIVPGRRSDGYCYTTKKSWIIRRSGKIEVADVTEAISVRKSIGRGSTTDIVHVYPYFSKPHYVILACDQDQNNLILQRVDGDVKKIGLPPAGNIHAEHHYTGTNWYFTLPAECLNRVNARVFHVPDAEALLNGNSSVRIDLGQNTWKRHPGIKYLA